MQFTQAVDVDMQVRIHYQDAEHCQMRLIATAPYAAGQRTATVTLPVTDEALQADVVALCERILQAHAATAARQAMSDAAQMEAVARSRGELA